MECGACAMNCPFSAISVAAGVGCAYAVIKGKFGKGEGCC
jgi:Fe-S-cluster-containing hydrogenase component 2